MELWMTDLDAAWWAKLRRASTHRETLARLVAEFQASKPYTLNPEPAEKPDEVAYRLIIRREAPAEISTVVGDVLHNLRSALDSLAYELAVQSKGAALTKREGGDIFSVGPQPEGIRRILRRWRRPRAGCADASTVRRRGTQCRSRNRSWTEMASLSVTERQQHSGDDFRWSAIHRLQKLSNIDKHRRLPALGVGWPAMFYWGSDEGDDTRFRPGHIPPTDNTILCYLVGPNAANIELHTEFALVLTDDPRHEPGTDSQYQPQDCQKLLASFAQQVEITVWRVLQELAAQPGRL